MASNSGVRPSDQRDRVEPVILFDIEQPPPYPAWRKYYPKSTVLSSIVDEVYDCVIGQITTHITVSWGTSPQTKYYVTLWSWIPDADQSYFKHEQQVHPTYSEAFVYVQQLMMQAQSDVALRLI